MHLFKQMTSQSLNHKNIAILSDDSVVFTALYDNSSYNIQLVNKTNYKDFFNSVGKIDLLIIDTEIEINNIDLYRVNSFVNLIGSKLLANEINFSKPFRLEKLLDIISGVMRDEHIFCCMNNSWIYNQFLAKIISVDMEISLTSRENDIFTALIRSKNFSTNKEFLKSKIWNYHQDSETTTVDIHLYKLKNSSFQQKCAL